MDVVAENKVSFQLRGGLYTLTTIVLKTQDLAEFAEELKAKISLAPNFFRNAPVVIDLSRLKIQNYGVDLSRLQQILLQSKLILVGIKGAIVENSNEANGLGIAVITDSVSNTKVNGANQKIEPEEPSEEKNQNIENNRTIVGQVRSGQQIYVPNGDLTVIGSVSHGAELLAEGNIHIYGSLRGRALAGINNNESAKIFCQSLESELVSIAGKYKVSEDIESYAWKVPAYISYAQGQIQINKI